MHCGLMILMLLYIFFYVNVPLSPVSLIHRRTVCYIFLHFNTLPQNHTCPWSLCNPFHPILSRHSDHPSKCSHRHFFDYLYYFGVSCTIYTYRTQHYHLLMSITRSHSCLLFCIVVNVDKHWFYFVAFLYIYLFHF